MVAVFIVPIVIMLILMALGIVSFRLVSGLEDKGNNITAEPPEALNQK